MSSGGSGLGSDDDPELIELAAPFGLKTMEGLLEETPEHLGLLAALASGYVQYAYAFVEDEAFMIEPTDFGRAEALRRRAKKLYRRARGFAFRGLEVSHPGFVARLEAGAPLDDAEVEDVPLLYWTAASWGLLISISLDEPDLIADFPLVTRLAERALELDESFGDGTLHELFITLETARPGGDAKKAFAHFERAIELSKGRRVGPYVSLAEKVSVKDQNVAQFRELLEKALAVDLEASPKDKLANTILRHRAEALLARVEDLFLDAGSVESP
ncbi:MAG: hypothetical protein HYV07_27900 [Deltaproteobacteria bacterium]|nr:hypothetical protein [Deltaproteobacteria bacterium]